MNIYELLEKDHQTVRSIFRELEQTSDRALKRREHLFSELNVELNLHTLAEEKFLYPLLKEADETHALALEAVEEHRLVKKILKELERGDKGSERWAARLKVLSELVEHHVEEEEKEMFKMARKVIPKDLAMELAAEIESFKEERTHVMEI
jgi:hemerythrin-like domain-containing protein